MTNNDLYDLLSNRNLVAETNPPVTDFCGNLIQKNEVKIVYGETYDGNGMTIDSLKYYFFASLLQKLLQQQNIKTTAKIIIGDVASLLNKSTADSTLIKNEINTKAHNIEILKKIFGLNINAILMSNLMKKDDFLNNRNKIFKSVTSSKELIKNLEKTVINNRLSEERKKGFGYATDEVALISNFDIKIGPPRERFYDEIVQKIKGQRALSSIYLKPTYPLGLGFDYFISHKETEEFGLTPYKAGSNRLKENRIIIGKTTEKQLEDLINNSFISSNSNLPNPVFDLLFISEMAKSFLNKTEFNFKMLPLFSFDTLRKKAYTQIIKYIFEPLKYGGFYE